MKRFPFKGQLLFLLLITDPSSRPDGGQSPVVSCYLGFVFYWSCWCLLVPHLLIGTRWTVALVKNLTLRLLPPLDATLGEVFLGYLYPVIGFALWHLSPQVTRNSEVYAERRIYRPVLGLGRVQHSIHPLDRSLPHPPRFFEHWGFVLLPVTGVETH